METTLRRVVDTFARLRVVVVGDAILDRYLRGTTARLSREAPVPVVDLGERHDLPGGAANAAINLAALGAQVTLVAAIGDDAEGEALRNVTATGGVDVSALVVAPERTTLAKHRLTAGAQLLVRFDQGSTEQLSGVTEAAVVDRLLALLPAADALVISDYESGIRTQRVLGVLADRDAAQVCAIDARAPAAWHRLRPTAVKPNYDEAARLLGLPDLPSGDGRADAVAAHGARLLELCGADIAAVTLDADGAIVLERDQPAYRTYALRAEAARSTGCGDTYAAALTLALAAGAGTVAAAELASAAAAVVVQKPGTAVCSAVELLREDPAAVKNVPSAAMLAGVVRSHRLAGRRIVFTNGCFDILHRGHVTYLSRAKALGDVLIVAVNGDASVGRLKGSGRPVNPLEDRLAVLAALSCVDHVVAFGADSPTELLRAARPDVYVKGGDYTRETLPEASLVEALGGTVSFLDYLEDRSTSGIIKRIAAEVAR